MENNFDEDVGPSIMGSFVYSFVFWTKMLSNLNWAMSFLADGKKPKMGKVLIDSSIET